MPSATCFAAAQALRRGSAPSVCVAAREHDALGGRRRAVRVAARRVDAGGAAVSVRVRFAAAVAVRVSRLR
jgi:hypothetical protein